MHWPSALGICGVCAALSTVIAAEPQHTIKFLAHESKQLGEIDMLTVTVTCGRVIAMRDIPELYNITMGYDMPTENVFEAQPRLGAAAVALNRWSGRLTVASEDSSCFAVKVHVLGRNGELDLGSTEVLSRK